MKPLLVLDGISLADGGSGLSMEIYAGDRFVVMGAAAAGKSYFLDILEGIEKAKGGSVKSTGKVIAASNGGYGRRATPQTIARDVAKRGEQGRAALALTALGLWDVLDRPYPQLSPGQMVACDLLPCLMQDPDVILIDGHLDVIDPWTLEGIFEMLDDPAGKSVALIVATCQPSLARRLGALVILRNRNARFVGTVEELIESVRPAELVVETDDKSAVRAMAEPYTVSVKSTEGGLVMTSHEGQALAARLLTHGYGRVRSIILREPTLEEALRLVH